MGIIIIEEFKKIQAIKEIIRDYVEFSIDDLAWKLYEEVRKTGEELDDFDIEEVITKVRENLSLDIAEREE